MTQSTNYSTEKITDVNIVDYQTPIYTQKCVESVLINTDAPYHLTVFDNYFHDYNLSVAWNKLVERSDSEFVCLLNSDTEVTAGWLTNILHHFDDETAIVGPTTNKCGYEIQIRNGPAKEKNALDTTHVSGFCIVFRKSAWEEVGGFDEKYELYGEDDQFCKDIREAGYKIKVAEDSFVHHEKGASKEVAEARGKDIDSIQKESANRFRNG